MSYAQDHKWIARNPTKGINSCPEAPRVVNVTRAQLDRLYRVIEKGRDAGMLATIAIPWKAAAGAANAIKLLVWTGARRNEVLGAKWSEFNLERREWTRTGGAQ